MKKLFCITLLMTLVCSCQQKKENQPSNTSPSFEAERNAFFNNLKSPAEIAEKLKATSVEFDASLMSDPRSFAAYANNPTKAAANLGIYLSDLNYSVAYQQASHTKELFNAAYELSKVMGLEKKVLDFLMQRYANNIDQNDSVKVVVNTLFEKSTRGLVGTDRERLVGIAMAAYQIENLHLVLGVIESLPKDMPSNDKRAQALAPLFQIVVDQKNNIEITYGFLKSITDITDPDKNPNLPYYGNAFKELIDVYNRSSLNSPATKRISDETIKELGEKVNAIRNRVVSVE
jgi:hypothetical protein